MAKTGLIVFGIIILIITFFITQVMITPQQKQQVQLANQLCNFNIYGIPAAQIIQSLSPVIAAQCEQAKTAYMIVTWGWIGYVVGFFILVMGLAMGGGGKTIIREVIREPVPTHVEHHKEKLESKEKHKSETKESKSKTKGKKFCSECGTQLSPNDAFCPECGVKVK